MFFYILFSRHAAILFFPHFILDIVKNFFDWNLWERRCLSFSAFTLSNRKKLRFSKETNPIIHKYISQIRTKGNILRNLKCNQCNFPLRISAIVCHFFSCQNECVKLCYRFYIRNNFIRWQLLRYGGYKTPRP